MNPAQNALLEKRDGWDVGRDPRQVSREDLIAAGHKPMSPLKALRARCIDCCADQPSEVRLCTAVTCPSWPFRMGANPWRKEASDAQREARRKAGARLARGVRKSISVIGADATPPPAGTVAAADALASRTQLTVEDFHIPATASGEAVR
jgi:hypothetical protein